MIDGLTIQDNGIPIYVQLREQILALIGRGTLKPGTQVPTMRQVAVALKIDLNTVQRAYAELERDGVLTKQRGVGTFVTDTAPPPRNTKKQVQDFAARIAAQAKGQGVPLEELAEALTRLAGRA
ncbi:MAG TPA: GntR family transcriptional regulator [Rhizomicrobium sp.]|jgi:GntR family transcriptional regulator|nr:GntR family transcriptional regulator [Rhizomicrobium sp.]